MGSVRLVYPAILIVLLFVYAEGSCQKSESCKACVKDVNCIWCQPKNDSISNGTEICISGTFFNGPSEGKDYCSHYRWGQCTIDGMLMGFIYTYIILAAIGILILLIIIIVSIVLCCKFCPFDDYDDSVDTELQKSSSKSITKTNSSSSINKDSEYDRRRREMFAKVDSSNSSQSQTKEEPEIVAPIKVETISPQVSSTYEEKPETPPESQRATLERDEGVEVRVYRAPSAIVVSANGSIREETEEDRPETPPLSRHNSRRYPRPRTPTESETEPEALDDDDKEPTLRMSPMPTFNRATQDFGDIEASLASLQRDLERIET